MRAKVGLLLMLMLGGVGKMLCLPSDYSNEVINHACIMPMNNLLFNFIRECVLYCSHMLCFRVFILSALPCDLSFILTTLDCNILQYKNIVFIWIQWNVQETPALFFFFIFIEDDTLHAKIWTVLGRLLLSKHLHHPWKQQKFIVLDIEAEVFKGLNGMYWYGSQL